MIDAYGQSPNDFPDLEPDPVDDPQITLRCGCDVYASDLTHDEGDCLEAQADALAWAEERRQHPDGPDVSIGSLHAALDDPAKHGGTP